MQSSGQFADEMPTFEELNSAPLGGIYAASEADVYAGGAGGFFHFDGIRWAACDVPGIDLRNKGFNAVDGSSGSDVYVVTSTLTGHWNGASWSTFASPTLVQDISVGSSSDIWFASPTQLTHYDGASTTTSYPSNATDNIKSVFAISPSAAIAVGDNGAITMWNGTAWAPASAGLGAGQSLSAVWASSATNAHAVGSPALAVHLSGTTWTALPTGQSVAFTDVRGSGMNDVFTAGGSGTIMHYDGTRWQPVRSLTSIDIRAASMVGTSTFFVGTTGSTPAKKLTLNRLERMIPW
jgi:hypothetical protein